MLMKRKNSSLIVLLSSSDDNLQQFYIFNLYNFKQIYSQKRQNDPAKTIWFSVFLS